MTRYDPPDPQCSHKPKGIVMAGDWDGMHASTAVCDRSDCIDDASAWAYAMTHQKPTFEPFGSAQ